MFKKIISIFCMFSLFVSILPNIGNAISLQNFKAGTSSDSIASTSIDLTQGDSFFLSITFNGNSATSGTGVLTLPSGYTYSGTLAGSYLAPTVDGSSLYFSYSSSSTTYSSKMEILTNSSASTMSSKAIWLDTNGDGSYSDVSFGDVTVNISDMPQISSATYSDADADGYLDSLTLVFSKSVTGTYSGFSIAQGSCTSARTLTAGSVITGTAMTLTFNECDSYDTGNKPSLIAATGSVVDGDGNNLEYTTSITESDGATPVIVSSTGLTVANNANIELNYSEGLISTATGGVTLQDKNSSVIDGTVSLGTSTSSNDTITFDPTSDLSSSLSPYVLYIDGSIVKDSVGNYGSSGAIAEINVTSTDSTGPTGSIEINSGTGYSKLTAITLTISGSDVSGVSRMCIYGDITDSADCSSSGNFVSYSTSESKTLTSGDGVKNISIFFEDSASNTGSVYSSSITLDTTEPSTTVNIGGGTYSSSQTITLTSEDGATIYTSLVDTGSSCPSSSPLTNFTTAGTGSTGFTVSEQKLCYFSVDLAGNQESSTNEDVYIIDSTAPYATDVTYSPTNLITSGSFVLSSITLSGSTLNGEAQDQYSIEVGGDGTWGNGTIIQTGSSISNGATTGVTISAGSMSEGVNTVRIFVANGTTTGSTSLSVTLDTTAPSSISLSINSGDSETTSQSVTLSISSVDTGSNVYQMAISETDPPTNWETYATSSGFTMSSGNGTKTIYIKIKDNAGNESSTGYDTITLDTTTPTVTANYGSGTYYGPIDVTLTSSDVSSTIYYSTDGSTPSTTYSLPVTLGNSTGTYTLTTYAAKQTLTGDTVTYTYTFYSTPTLTSQTGSNTIYYNNTGYTVTMALSGATITSGDTITAAISTGTLVATGTTTITSNGQTSATIEIDLGTTFESYTGNSVLLTTTGSNSIGSGTTLTGTLAFGEMIGTELTSQTGSDTIFYNSTGYTVTLALSGATISYGDIITAAISTGTLIATGTTTITSAFDTSATVEIELGTIFKNYTGNSVLLTTTGTNLSSSGTTLTGTLTFVLIPALSGGIVISDASTIDSTINSGTSSTVVQDSTGSVISTLSIFTGSSVSDNIGAFSGASTISVSKGSVNFDTSTGISQPILFIPTDTITDTDSTKVLLGIPTSVSFGSGLIIDPPVTKTTNEKSAIDAILENSDSTKDFSILGAIEIPTNSSSSVTFDGGYIDICIAAGGETTASNISVYYSTDGTTWSTDSAATSKTISNDTFCFQTNHLTNFAGVLSTTATTTATTTTSSSSSGGGGGGGGFITTVGTYVLPNTSSEKAMSTFDNVDFGKISDGLIKRQITMKDTSSKYVADIQKDTIITTSDGTAFQGTISAPKRISNTKVVKLNGSTSLRAIKIGSDTDKILFSKPVTLSIGVAGISSTFDRNKINIYSYDETSKEYVLEAANRTYDTKKDSISVDVDHFTTFAMFYGKAISSSCPIIDVEGHWAESFIGELCNKGIIKGQGSTGLFKPDTSINRAELLKMLMTYFNYEIESPTDDTLFEDINKSDWFASYVYTAKKLGLVEGYNITGTNKYNFKPGNNINRAEALAMIVKISKANTGDELVSDFTDVKSTDWYVNYVSYAFKKGIVSGKKPGIFAPHDSITRAESVKMILKSKE